jgi:hypothetical protein
MAIHGNENWSAARRAKRLSTGTWCCMAASQLRPLLPRLWLLLLLLFLFCEMTLNHEPASSGFFS